MREFIGLWFLAIPYPRRSFLQLEGKPAPSWGLVSILVRFVGTSLTSTLALQLLGYRPFVPSYLSILDDAAYYRVEIFLLPLFGIGAWLLASGMVHLIQRVAGRPSNIDWIMNVVGFSLLVVMPLVWLLDWAGIALGFYGADFTIPLHSAVSLWEVGLMATGFKRMGSLGWSGALLLGLLVKVGVYIPLAMLLVR